MAKKEKTSGAVRIKKAFLSPLNNRMLEPDVCMNVPKNQFWLRRIQAGDCEALKSLPKVSKPKTDKVSNKKGANK